MGTVEIRNYIDGDAAILYDDGEKCYQDIKLIVESGENVSLDFEGVEYAITAFLNPIIGDLILDYGKEIMNNVEIKNAEKTILDKIKLVKDGALIKSEDIEK